MLSRRKLPDTACGVSVHLCPHGSSWLREESTEEVGQAGWKMRTSRGLGRSQQSFLEEVRGMSTHIKNRVAIRGEKAILFLLAQAGPVKTSSAPVPFRHRPSLLTSADVG